MRPRTPELALVAAALLLLAAPPLALARSGAPPPGRSPGVGGVDTTSPEALPTALEEVGFDQLLGGSVPLDLTFLDEAGREVRLGDYFGEKPVILVPAYYECPMLCTLVLNSVASSLATVDFVPGRDFEVVVISFDPDDTPELAREKKRLTLLRYDRTPEGPAGGAMAGAGWHFLSGEPAAIHAVMAAIGFRYTKNDSTGEFAHTAGLVVTTPEGTIARYFFGLEYPGRDVRLSLVEAADGEIGSLADQVFLYCFRYDPATGQYSAASLNLVRAAGLLTVVALVAFVLLALFRERRRRMHNQSSPGIA